MFKELCTVRNVGLCLELCTVRNAGLTLFQSAFEVVGLISVITNCALIGMDPEVQKLLPSNMTAVNIVIIFVAVEVSLTN